jgi:hypothetical protein
VTQQQAGDAEHRILAKIAEMVADEKVLRDLAATGTIDSTTERERLTELERELDQCWDLLRQRRAKLEAGEDPGQARVRPADQVERYES